MADVNFKNIELVNRKTEMAKLQKYLNKVYRGHGMAVFISGEAGIGKTRVVEELIHKAKDMNFQIIRGQCIPENLEPLFPFKSAMKRASLDYILSNKPPPLVLSAYLIDSSGLVIAKAERRETSLDPDIFVGMLTAIEAFVKDSLKIMGTEENATLNSLSYGDYNILIQSSSTLSLATVIRGEPNEFLIEDMKLTLGNLGERFSNWKENTRIAEEAKPDVEWFISSKKYDGRYLAGEPSIVQENIFDNIVLGLQRLSEHSPLIVFIDDLQWADKTSLNFLYYLSRNTRNNRVLVIGTYRPEEIIPVSGGKLHPLEVTLNNLAGDNLVKIIGLARLNRDNTRILISRILGDFNPTIGTKIYKESGGNPLFVIEIIKLLISEKLIYREGKRWKLKVKAEKIIIPRKAYELIKRRLERVSDEEREILDVASVIGEEFDTALLALTTGMDELKILKRLNNIYRKHKLIYEKDGKYHFEHSTIREVLYNELLDELRCKYHNIIGDIIYEINRDNLGQVANILAHHYYEAHNSKAVQFLLEMGSRAKKNYANDEAITFYMRALELASDPEVRMDSLESIGDVMVYIGEYIIAEEKYIEAMKLAQDYLPKVRLVRKIADVYAKRGIYEHALKLLHESIAKMTEKMPVETGRTFKEIGLIYFLKGEYPQALEFFKKSLKTFASIKEDSRVPKRDMADILKGVGNIHLVLGDYEKAKKYYTKSLEIMKELGDMKEMAEILSDMGNVFLILGDLDRALKIYSSSLKIMKNVGFKFGISNLLTNTGNVYFRKGALKVALDYYNQSLEISEKIDQKGAMATVLTNIGNILYQIGNLDNALDMFTKSLKISREIGDRHTSAYALLNIGRIYLLRKDVDYAYKITRRAVDMIREVGDKTGYADALISLAEVNLEKGKLRDAESCAIEALNTSIELGSGNNEMNARRTLGMIYREKKYYRKAVIEFTKAIRYFMSEKSNSELARCYYEYGLMWKIRKDSEKARENLKMALDIFKSIHMSMWAQLCRNAIDEL